MAAMAENKDVRPFKSFPGRLPLKSRSSQRDVMIARKKTRAVTERQRATSEEIEKTSNAKLYVSMGRPVWSFSPPGTVADVANATPAINAATTEQDSEVLISHLVPSFTSSLCVSVKTCLGVSPFLLW